MYQRRFLMVFRSAPAALRATSDALFCAMAGSIFIALPSRAATANGGRRRGNDSSALVVTCLGDFPPARPCGHGGGDRSLISQSTHYGIERCLRVRRLGETNRKVGDAAGRAKRNWGGRWHARRAWPKPSSRHVHAQVIPRVHRMVVAGITGVPNLPVCTRICPAAPVGYRLLAGRTAGPVAR